MKVKNPSVTFGLLLLHLLWTPPVETSSSTHWLTQPAHGRGYRSYPLHCSAMGASRAWTSWSCGWWRWPLEQRHLLPVMMISCCWTPPPWRRCSGWSGLKLTQPEMMHIILYLQLCKMTHLSRKKQILTWRKFFGCQLLPPCKWTQSIVNIAF